MLEAQSQPPAGPRRHGVTRADQTAPIPYTDVSPGNTKLHPRSRGRQPATLVSRNPKGHGSNAVYKRLRERGYVVFAVNPNADQVEGDRCYHDLKEIPDGVDAVVIATRADLAEATMRECAALGIKHAWMHRSFGNGSVSDDATVYGREHGITVIDGGCPLMFAPTADVAHKVMRLMLAPSKKVPKTV